MYEPAIVTALVRARARSGLSSLSSNFIMNSIQRRRSLRMAWATLATVVSGSPYERKMLATSSVSTSGTSNVSPPLSSVLREIMLCVRAGSQVASETHRDRTGRDLGQAGRDHDAGRFHHA